MARMHRKGVRAKSIAAKRLTSSEILAAHRLPILDDYDRPVRRGDCLRMPRPCPFASCRHHLAVDVSPGGTLKLNFPDVEIEDMKETCSLDIADRHGVQLEVVGEIMSLTRERVRQIEVRATIHHGIGMRKRGFDGSEILERAGSRLQEAAIESGKIGWAMLDKHLTRRFRQLGWSLLMDKRRSYKRRLKSGT